MTDPKDLQTSVFWEDTDAMGQHIAGCNAIYKNGVMRNLTVRSGHLLTDCSVYTLDKELPRQEMPRFLGELVDGKPIDEICLDTDGDCETIDISGLPFEV